MHVLCVLKMLFPLFHQLDCAKEETVEDDRSVWSVFLSMMDFLLVFQLCLATFYLFQFTMCHFTVLTFSMMVLGPLLHYMLIYYSILC